MDYGKSLIIICLTLSWMSLGTGTAEARVETIPGSAYKSARAAGLGNAFLPLADDGASGLLANPSAIGLLKRTHFEPLNLQLGVNGGYAGSFDLNFFNATSLQNYLETLQSNPGTFQGFQTSLFPNFFFRGFAFGLFTQIQNYARFFDNQVTYQSLYQVTPAIGFAIPLARGIVRIGYSLLYINESSGSVTTTDTTDLAYNKGIAQGSGLSHNIAFGMTLPVQFLPSVSLVARNVGGTSFTSFSLVPLASETTGAPEADPMTIDAAVSIAPKFGRGGILNWVIEGKDLTNTSGFDLLKRLSTGMEFNFKDSIYLRLGFGAMYPSAGFGVRGPKSDFSLSYTNEEVGTPDNPEKDTKFSFQYQFRMF